METARLIATVWLMALVVFLWGFTAQRYHWLPYHSLNKIFAYAEGSNLVHTTVWDNILNDFNIRPNRSIRKFTPTDETLYHNVTLPDINPRRQQPRVYLNNPPAGFRLLVGAFDFQEAFWGAVLLDETGKVLHTWKLSGEVSELNYTLDVLKNLYGVAVFPDGSIIYNMQEINQGIIKRNYCSDVAWVSAGLYHHVVAPTDDNQHFWTYKGYQSEAYPILTKLSSETGEIIKEINVKDVYKKNPNLYIFDHRNIILPMKEKTHNYPHPNDIKPLPANLASAFPQFSPGDLAINYHTTGIMYVLDPETLQVKFWESGIGDGQHDIDWQPDGTFSLFNNQWRVRWENFTEAYSTITSIDPKTRNSTVLVDGRHYNLYSSINSAHEITPMDTVLITSSTQGRFLEIDRKTGEVVFEFINDYDVATHATLHVSNAFFLPKDFFNFDVYNPDRCRTH